MLLPETIDRVQNDVTLEALDRRRFFVTRFALVGVLDFLDQELRVLFDRARLELRPFLSLGQAGTWCSPNAADRRSSARPASSPRYSFTFAGTASSITS